MLIAPAPHPAKVFGDIPAAVAWIEPFVSQILGRPVGGKELLDVVMDHVTAFRARDA